MRRTYDRFDFLKNLSESDSIRPCLVTEHLYMSFKIQKYSFTQEENLKGRRSSPQNRSLSQRFEGVFQIHTKSKVWRTNSKHLEKMNNWVEVARALVQIGKKEDAIKVLKSKILGRLLLKSCDDDNDEDTIVKGLFLMVMATSNVSKQKSILKILRRRMKKRYEDDHAVLDVLESKPMTRRKNLNQVSPLLLEFVRTNTIQTYRWCLSNKVELMLRIKACKNLIKYIPRTTFVHAHECAESQTKSRVCREIGVPNPCWFVKRGAKDRGNGIFTCFSIEDLKHSVEGLDKNLIDCKKDEYVSSDELLLVQQCPEKLMLWNSRKFHLRVFVLSPKHLNRVWLFKDAICYASTSTYDEKTRHREVHLTNFSQQGTVANDMFQGVASMCLRSKTWFRAVSNCVYDIFSELRSSLLKDTGCEDKDDDDDDDTKKENLFDLELLGLDMILTTSSSSSSENCVKILEINQLPTVDVTRQTEKVQKFITRPMINGILDIISNRREEASSMVWENVSLI